jgi:hypothetical protein
MALNKLHFDRQRAYKKALEFFEAAPGMIDSLNYLNPTLRQKPALAIQYGFNTTTEIEQFWICFNDLK